jgi:hypothetical protein
MYVTSLRIYTITDNGPNSNSSSDREYDECGYGTSGVDTEDNYTTHVTITIKQGSSCFKNLHVQIVTM